MTVSEAAETLGITTDAVRQAIRRNRIDGRQLSKTGIWLVTSKSVEAYRAYSQPDGKPRVGRLPARQISMQEV